jgi:hypothetical protein
VLEYVDRKIMYLEHLIANWIDQDQRIILRFSNQASQFVGYSYLKDPSRVIPGLKNSSGRIKIIHYKIEGAPMPELTSTNHSIETWLNHIHSLAVDIGPRGPTRPGERLGALYAQAQFERIGLQPIFETFSSAKSIFHPHLLGSGLILLAFILFLIGGRISAILAALLSIFVLVCELLELSFQNNPFRKLVPKGESQNVFAIIPPAGEHHHDLVLVAT